MNASAGSASSGRPSLYSEATSVTFSPVSRVKCRTVLLVDTCNGRWLPPGLPAQARVEEQAENLGLGPEMGQHLGDRPVRRVGLSLQLVRAERAGHRSQPFVRVPQGFNPRGGTGLHAGSP